MASKLVVNGCSYMVSYGEGHRALSQQLNLFTSESIARPGSCNNRIIRTTLKHSYQTTESCFYLVGLTFPTREERPIANSDHKFEGRWISIQNGFLDTNFDSQWTQDDCDLYMKLKTKILMTDNIIDIIEDLMYRVLSMINDLQRRGHQVLVFQQVNNEYDRWKNNPRLALLKDNVHIINGLGWFAIPWQINQGAQTNDFGSDVPQEFKHIASGEHHHLNNFLKNYIRNNNVHV